MLDSRIRFRRMKAAVAAVGAVVTLSFACELEQAQDPATTAETAVAPDGTIAVPLPTLEMPSITGLEPGQPVTVRRVDGSRADGMYVIIRRPDGTLVPGLYRGPAKLGDHLSNGTNIFEAGISPRVQEMRSDDRIVLPGRGSDG